MNKAKKPATLSEKETLVEHHSQLKGIRLWYPVLAGLFFGLLQTGLFFQLSFSLSSGFTTFLMITLCWLLGSAVGLFLANEHQRNFNWFFSSGLLAYFVCVLLLRLAPFETRLWPAYALLVAVMGLAPGVFFGRMAGHYAARDLFFRENNGFIAGLAGGTLLFLLTGRLALWFAPILVAVVLLLGSRYFSQKSTA